MICLDKLSRSGIKDSLLLYVATINENFKIICQQLVDYNKKYCLLNHKPHK